MVPVLSIYTWAKGHNSALSAALAKSQEELLSATLENSPTQLLIFHLNFAWSVFSIKHVILFSISIWPLELEYLFSFTDYEVVLNGLYFVTYFENLVVELPLLIASMY